MHSNEESVQTKLDRIAKKASTDKDCQFTCLDHLMNKELLLECFTQLKGKADPLLLMCTTKTHHSLKPLHGCTRNGRIKPSRLLWADVLHNAENTIHLALVLTVFPMLQHAPLLGSDVP